MTSPGSAKIIFMMQTPNFMFSLHLGQQDGGFPTPARIFFKSA